MFSRLRVPAKHECISSQELMVSLPFLWLALYGPLHCFMNKINTFIDQGIKRIDSEYIYNVTKYSISNKCCSFELSIR